MKRIIYILGAVLAFALCVGAGTAPVVFWASDSVAPGNVVLVYGGGLGQIGKIRVWRLTDGDAKTPEQKPSTTAAPASASSQVTLQARDGSLKFILPEQFAPGLFAAELQAGPRLSSSTVRSCGFCKRQNFCPDSHKTKRRRAQLSNLSARIFCCRMTKARRAWLCAHKRAAPGARCRRTHSSVSH